MPRSYSFYNIPLFFSSLIFLIHRQFGQTHQPSSSSMFHRLLKMLSAYDLVRYQNIYMINAKDIVRYQNFIFLLLMI